jgi:hypothetical protein
MKLSIDHTFAIAPAEYATLYFDEPFSIALSASAKLGRTLLRLDRTPARVVRQVRCEPARDVPAPLAKLLDRGFHYVEELDFDLATLHGRWRVVPSVFADRVDASGTLFFEPAAADQVKRSVRGEINVSVFGVGSLAERFVVGEVLKGYEAASSFTRSFLAERAGKDEKNEKNDASV